MVEGFHYYDKKAYNLYVIVKDVLIKSGFLPKFRGFTYIIQAVVMCYNDNKYLELKSKGLYIELARINGIGISSVERNIRNAINHAWDRDTGNNFYELIGCDYVFDNKKPTCGEIIDLLTYFLIDTVGQYEE